MIPAETFYSFILNPDFTGWLLAVKIIFIILALAMLAFVIWALGNTSWYNFWIGRDLAEWVTFKPSGLRKFLKNWDKIKKRLESGSEAELKLALIEADAMLDETLKRLGYAGDSLGERLDKLTVDLLPDIENIRGAHKIHSNIIHDPAYKLNLGEVKRIFAVYEKALTDLGAL